MRAWLVAGLMAVTGIASAQDGAHVVTLAKVRGESARLAGEFIRVENVTILDFSPSKGGLASDATGSVRLDDFGMPAQTIKHLERHCGGPRTGQGHAGCRGALEFTVTGREGDGGRFTISEADFIPED